MSEGRETVEGGRSNEAWKAIAINRRPDAGAGVEEPADVDRRNFLKLTGAAAIVAAGAAALPSAALAFRFEDGRDFQILNGYLQEIVEVVPQLRDYRVFIVPPPKGTRVSRGSYEVGVNIDGKTEAITDLGSILSEINNPAFKVEFQGRLVDHLKRRLGLEFSWLPKEVEDPVITVSEDARATMKRWNIVIRKDHGTILISHALEEKSNAQPGGIEASYRDGKTVSLNVFVHDGRLIFQVGNIDGSLARIVVYDDIRLGARRYRFE